MYVSFAIIKTESETFFVVLKLTKAKMLIYTVYIHVYVHSNEPVYCISLEST